MWDEKKCFQMKMQSTQSCQCRSLLFGQWIVLSVTWFPCILIMLPSPCTRKQRDFTDNGLFVVHRSWPQCASQTIGQIIQRN